jgi:hypothetical protein
MFIFKSIDDISSDVEEYTRGVLMLKRNGSRIILARLVLAILMALSWAFLMKLHPVQAGSGPTIDIPQSNIVPVMDGVCNPTEYSDANQISVTVGTSHTFPVYLKHTANDAYFCYGSASGLPLPDGGASQVAIYIDTLNNGQLGYQDDFGVWMPYDPAGVPWAAYWGTSTYNGADPGGWEAVKHQVSGGSPLWQVEFRISRQTLGGWKRTVGMAAFYHWWAWQGDDYSWPANGIWAIPGLWGNGKFTTGSVDIGLSTSVPSVDGQCGSEYSDASTVSFNTSSGIATAYLEHSQTDLYVCLHDLAVPAPSQQDTATAALYIDRTGTGGGTPSPNDLAFTITYNGTVDAGSGDGAGYTGPDPGGYAIEIHHYGGGWDAEFQISSATIGDWWSRKIGLTVAEQGVSAPGNDYGWPTGYSHTVPNSWGEANLEDLGNPPPIFLPLVTNGF